MRGYLAFTTVLALLGGACAESRRHVLTAGGAAGMAGLAGSPGAPVFSVSGGGGIPPSVTGGGGANLGAPCEPSREVASDDEALLVRDPEVLARFPLERVLTQLIETSYERRGVQPLELMQGLFATASDRAEARLAESAALLSADDPDGFFPVALVNRFDLMTFNFSTCGAYSLVYAKRSGLTEPAERVFVSIQLVLPSPVWGYSTCRPVAEMWAALPGADVEVRAAALEQFFFEGQAPIRPAIHAEHLAVGETECDARGHCGQVQVGLGMQAPWQFRQFKLALTPPTAGEPALFFEPAPASTSIRPELFDASLPDPLGEHLRQSFLSGIVGLAFVPVPRMYLHSFAAYELGESAVEGPSAPSYADHALQSASDAFLVSLDEMIALQGAPSCPPEDPLDAVATLRRAAALSCAGCHAPEQTIAPGREIGCGQAWPASLGVTHIDEQGELSAALREVFLPERARVLSTYLQACDELAIMNNVRFE